MKTKEVTAKVDETQALKRVAAFEKDVDEVLALLGEGMKLVLADDVAYERAADVLLDVKAQQKIMAEEHEGFLVDAKRLIDRVNGWFKPALEKAARAEKAYKEALRDYKAHLEARAHGLREAARKLPEKEAKKRDALLDEADALSPPKVAGISFQAGIEIEVFDFEKLPREYKQLVADNKAIKAAVEKGEHIPGVRWSSSPVVRVTPKHAGREA